MESFLKRNVIDPDFALYTDRDCTQATIYNLHNTYVQSGICRIHRIYKTIAGHTKRNARILDVGASPFYLSYLLSRYHGAEVDALFFSNDAHPLKDTSDAYFQGGNITLKHENIEQGWGSLGDDKYDGVIIAECLEHLDRFPFEFLTRLKDQMADEAVLYITVPNAINAMNIVRLILNKNIYYPYRPDPSGRHKYEYTISGVRNVFSDCMGLDIRRLTAFCATNNQTIKAFMTIVSLGGLLRGMLPTIEFLGQRKASDISQPDWSRISPSIYLDAKSIEA